MLFFTLICIFPCAQTLGLRFYTSSCFGKGLPAPVAHIEVILCVRVFKWKKQFWPTCRRRKDCCLWNENAENNGWYPFREIWSLHFHFIAWRTTFLLLLWSKDHRKKTMMNDDDDVSFENRLEKKRNYLGFASCLQSSKIYIFVKNTSYVVEAITCELSVYLERHTCCDLWPCVCRERWARVGHGEPGIRQAAAQQRLQVLQQGGQVLGGKRIITFIHE